MTDNQFESKAHRITEELEVCIGTFRGAVRPIALGLILIARCIHENNKPDEADCVFGQSKS